MTDLGEKILNLPMAENDADAETVADYLIALLQNVWSEGEGFSGKRPFGNSGWEHELYEPLITAELVISEKDEDGEVIDFDRSEANSLIFEAISSF